MIHSQQKVGVKESLLSATTPSLHLLHHGFQPLSLSIMTCMAPKHSQVRSPPMSIPKFHENRREFIGKQIPSRLLLSGPPEDKPGDGTVPALVLMGSCPLPFPFQKEDPS